MKHKEPDAVIKTPFSEIKLYVHYKEDPVKLRQFPEDLFRVLRYIAKEGGWLSEFEEFRQAKERLEKLLEAKGNKSL